MVADPLYEDSSTTVETPEIPTQVTGHFIIYLKSLGLYSPKHQNSSSHAISG